MKYQIGIVCIKLIAYLFKEPKIIDGVFQPSHTRQNL